MRGNFVKVADLLCGVFEGLTFTFLSYRWGKYVDGHTKLTEMSNEVLVKSLFDVFVGELLELDFTCSCKELQTKLIRDASKMNWHKILKNLKRDNVRLVGILNYQQFRLENVSGSMKYPNTTDGAWQTLTTTYIYIALPDRTFCNKWWERLITFPAHRDPVSRL